MSSDDFEFEPSDPDEWEDYDPDRVFEEDEYEGFEVYDTTDEYIERFGYRGDDEDEDE